MLSTRPFPLASQFFLDYPVLYLIRSVLHVVMNERKIVAALDIGTTSLRCHCYNEKAILLGSASSAIQLSYPKPGYVEIDPEDVFEKIVQVVNDSIKYSGLRPEQINCLGISCQRSSFVTWSKSTGKPYHPIITWRDLRADRIVKSFNRSVWFKSLKVLLGGLYKITRKDRLLMASRIRITNQQVAPRLHWVLNNIPELRKAVQEGDAAFGTFDSWILYKLSGGVVHVTDVSHASCTGLYDPFKMQWSQLFTKLFSIPKIILPKVLESDATFCVTHPQLFGVSIPITCSLADQSASMFGSCCFNTGDIKCTLGTGAFIDVHTGNKPFASIGGLYPLVAWKINGETAFLAEGASNDSGTIIKWAEKIGFFDDPKISSTMASSVSDTDGVCFIPAFNGLQAPINDDSAAAGIIGIKPTTSREHMVRAMLESVAFRVDQLFDLVKKETKADFSKISLDGGVSKNDFIAQTIADLTCADVTRPASSEMSALGAAYVAGLSSGIWRNRQEFVGFSVIDRTFKPDSQIELESRVEMWRASLCRFKAWYT